MIRGNTPFWDKNRRQMFQNILTGEPYFDPEIFSPRSQSFLRGIAHYFIQIYLIKILIY